jgi:hypothetical protein
LTASEYSTVSKSKFYSHSFSGSTTGALPVASLVTRRDFLQHSSHLLAGTAAMTVLARIAPAATLADLATLKADIQASGCKITAFLMATRFDVQTEQQVAWLVQAAQAAEALGVPAIRIDIANRRPDASGFLQATVETLKQVLAPAYYANFFQTASASCRAETPSPASSSGHRPNLPLQPPKTEAKPWPTTESKSTKSSISPARASGQARPGLRCLRHKEFYEPGQTESA